MNQHSTELQRQHSKWKAARQRLSGTTCPCCGAPIPGLPIDGLQHVPMTTQQHRIVDALVSIFPRTASLEFLIDAVWGDRPDGGPNGDLINHLAVQQVKINKVIEPTGWRVSGAYNGRAGHRRLMQIAPSAVAYSKGITR